MDVLASTRTRGPRDDRRCFLDPTTPLGTYAELRAFFEGRCIRQASFVGPRCQIRIEGGVMDEQTESRQRPHEQLPSSEEEWRQRLSPEQFEVLRNKGTEHAFTGEYAFTKDR